MVLLVSDVPVELREYDEKRWSTSCANLNFKIVNTWCMLLWSSLTEPMGWFRNLKTA